MDNIFPKQFKFWYPGNVLEEPDEVPANHQTLHELDGREGWTGKRRETRLFTCCREGRGPDEGHGLSWNQGLGSWLTGRGRGVGGRGLPEAAEALLASRHSPALSSGNCLDPGLGRIGKVAPTPHPRLTGSKTTPW